MPRRTLTGFVVRGYLAKTCPHRPSRESLHTIRAALAAFEKYRVGPLVPPEAALLVEKSLARGSTAHIRAQYLDRPVGWTFDVPRPDILLSWLLLNPASEAYFPLFRRLLLGRYQSIRGHLVASLASFERTPQYPPSPASAARRAATVKRFETLLQAMACDEVLRVKSKIKGVRRASRS